MSDNPSSSFLSFWACNYGFKSQVNTPAKMYSLCAWKAQNIFCRILENSLIPSKGLYNLSVYLTAELQILKKTVLVTVIYLRFFHHLQLHPYFVHSLRNECFRRVHVPWTLVGWACLPAPGHPEIPTENCSWIAWVAFIELGSDFLMKNLICIVFSISNATDMLQTHAQTVSKVCAVWYWLLGKSGLKYHISIQRQTWLQALGTKLH